MPKRRYIQTQHARTRAYQRLHMTASTSELTITFAEDLDVESIEALDVESRAIV